MTADQLLLWVMISFVGVLGIIGVIYTAAWLGLTVAWCASATWKCLKDPRCCRRTVSAEPKLLSSTEIEMNEP